MAKQPGWHLAPRPTHANWRDLTGRVFSRLTVREYVGRGNKTATSYWVCDCECGKETVVSSANLKAGGTTSCGCWCAEKSTLINLRHGHKRQGARTPEYSSWSGMRDRCLNPTDPAFHKYGGRGITICDRWDLFDNFLADMGPRPAPKYSIDRIDNNGPYSPDNCRWATFKEQGRNRRNNRLVEFRGRMVTLAEVAEIVGVRYAPLMHRVCAGWPLDRAIETPVRKRAS